MRFWSDRTALRVLKGFGTLQKIREGKGKGWQSALPHDELILILFCLLTRNFKSITR